MNYEPMCPRCGEPVAEGSERCGPNLDKVSPALVEELQRLGRQYGPLGVLRTARQLVRETRAARA